MSILFKAQRKLLMVYVLIAKSSKQREQMLEILIQKRGSVKILKLIFSYQK